MTMMELYPRQYAMRIAGRDAEPQTGEYFDSIEPYSGRVWARIPRGSAADASAAVEAANAALVSPAWSAITATARGAIMRRCGDAVARHAERLAGIEVTDNGKLMSEMLGQLRYIPEWFYYFGGLTDKIEGQVIPSDKPGMLNYTIYEPLGVIAAIVPWNSPLLLVAWKLAPALAAGNTMVVKPSEFTSASMIEFAKLLEEEGGLPPGVINVVTGLGAEVGDALVRHPGVARVAFTGGDAGGKAVYEAAASGLKDVTLELGGKSANIIFADADLDEAVTGAVSGIFAATGQSCMAGSRLLVEDSVHDEIVERLVRMVAGARLGDPKDPKTQIGPIATPAQFDKVLRYIQIAKDEGAICALGGKRAERPECRNGLFVEPTIFSHVTPQMRIAREEVFGPVLSIIRFRTEDEAIEIANGTRYGLAAGVWTSDIRRSVELPRRLQAGTVWVNAYRVVSVLSPFGGYKASGIGRENGQAAIRDYLQTKSVFVNTRKGVDNPFVMR